MTATRPVRRACLLGGESSGKTTLARVLAERLGTAWVPEYGRQRWEELRVTLDAQELVAVARRQVQWEDERATQPHVQAQGWLVCDTSPLTTLQYCLYDHGQAPAELEALSHRPYDLVVVCAPDFDFVQDGARRDDSFRQAQHQWTLARLHERGQPYITVHGSVEERVAQLMPQLARPRPPAAPTP